MGPKPADFDYGALLGNGSFAKVLLCRQKNTKQAYAVKVIDKYFITKMKKTATVHNEKKVMMRLKHPNIVRLRFTFQDAQCLYFVMDLAHKGAMFDQLRRVGAYSSALARFYAAELVSTIEHMHGLGIVHRDLKPENILLRSDRHLLLCDFGTAKILPQEGAEGDEEKRARANSFVGTAEYVSPEVLDDKPAGRPVDLWALGCVTYHMLVGRPPFKGRSEHLTFQLILARDFRFPDEVDENASPEKRQEGHEKDNEETIDSPVVVVNDVDADAKSFVNQLLVLEPEARLGCSVGEWSGYEQIRSHAFFQGLRWEELPQTAPPACEDPEGGDVATGDDAFAPGGVGGEEEDSDEAEMFRAAQEVEAAEMEYPQKEAVAKPAGGHGDEKEVTNKAAKAEEGGEEEEEGAPQGSLEGANACKRHLREGERLVAVDRIVPKRGLFRRKGKDWLALLASGDSSPIFIWVDGKTGEVKKAIDEVENVQVGKKQALVINPKDQGQEMVRPDLGALAPEAWVKAWEELLQ